RMLLLHRVSDLRFGDLEGALEAKLPRVARRELLDGPEAAGKLRLRGQTAARAQARQRRHAIHDALRQASVRRVLPADQGEHGSLLDDPVLARIRPGAD